MGQSSDDDEKLYGQKEKGWMLGERARFKLGLMALGYGRWQEIKTMARITRWSVHEIAMYGKAFLSKAILFAEVDDPKLIDLIQNPSVPKVDPSAPASEESTADQLEDAPVGDTDLTSPNNGEVASAETTSANFERDPSLCDAKFQEYLQKNAKQVIRRLETLATLRELVQSSFAAFDEIEVPEPPAPWWGAEEDRSLLLGTYKHGFGRYDEIRSDPALCFAGRNVIGVKEDQPEAVQAPVAGKDAQATQQAISTIKSEPGRDVEVKAEPGREVEVKAETGIQVPTVQADVQEDVKPLVIQQEVKPLHNSQDTKSLDTAQDKPLDTQEAKPSDTQEAKPFDTQEDKPLDIQGDKPPSSVQESKPLISAQENKTLTNEALVWPSSKILSHRVKRILRSMGTVKRQQDKDSKKVFPSSI